MPHAVLRTGRPCKERFRNRGRLRGSSPCRGAEVLFRSAPRSKDEEEKERVWRFELGWPSTANAPAYGSIVLLAVGWAKTSPGRTRQVWRRPGRTSTKASYHDAYFKSSTPKRNATGWWETMSPLLCGVVLLGIAVLRCRFMSAVEPA